MDHAARHSRRRFLHVVGATAVAGLAGCSSGGEGTTTTPTATTSTATPTPDLLAVEGSWPMAGYGPGNSGHVPDTSGPAGPPSERWSLSLVLKWGQQLRVSDGILVAGHSRDPDPSNVSPNNSLYGFDAATGVRQWVYPYEGPTIAPSVAISDGQVFVQDREAVVALDLVSGEQVWSRQVQEEPLGPYTVVEDTLYVIGGESGPIALDTATGRVRWRADLPRELQLVTNDFHQQVILNDRLFVADTRAKRLYAFDRHTGRRHWQRSFAETGFGILSAGSGVVVCDSRQVFDPETGNVRWQAPHPTDIPAVAGDTVVFGTISRGTTAFDADSGEQQWSAPVEFYPTIADDTVYVAGKDGLSALDLADGSIRWEIEQPGSARPVVLDGAIYLADRVSDTISALATEKS